MGVAQSSRSTVIKHVAAVVNTTKQQGVTGNNTLTQNLKKIGQVNVQSPASIQRSLQMTHVLRTRALSEPSSIQSNGGRTIDAFGLSELLDARKDAHASTPAKAQQLAERYRLDEELIRRLARRYNTPSVGRENTIELTDGDRRMYREAIWVDAGQAKSHLQAAQD